MHKPETQKALSAWYNEITSTPITSPADIKALYRHASFVANNRVVFNICGNKYRLIVAFNTTYTVGFVKFVGTHQDYNAIDAATV